MPWYISENSHPEADSEVLEFSNNDAGFAVSRLRLYASSHMCLIVAFASSDPAYEYLKTMAMTASLKVRDRDRAIVARGSPQDRDCIALLQLVQSLDREGYTTIQRDIADFLVRHALPSRQVAAAAPSALSPPAPPFPPRPLSPRSPLASPVAGALPPPLPSHTTITKGAGPDSSVEFTLTDHMFFAIDPTPEFDFDSIPLPSVSPSHSPLRRLTDRPVRVSYGRTTLEPTQINYDDPNLPAIEPRLQNTIEVTLGDLHANTLTLIIILIKCGILICTQADYNILRYIIQTISDSRPGPNDPPGPIETPLTIDLYLAFQSALARSRKITQDRPSLRLLGDILGDRMSNDALTLAVIGYLCEGTPLPLTIIFSNHDENLIRLLTYPPWEEPEYYGSPAISIIRFRAFLMSLPPGHPVKSQIASHIQQYVACIKVFDYNVEERVSAGRRFNLYSHASFHPRIGLETMKLLNPTYFIPHRSLGDLTVGKIQQLIDSTNTEFFELLFGLANNWINSFMERSAFNLNNPERLRYLDLYRYSHDPRDPGYPGYPYFSIWLRLANTHAPFEPLGRSWQFPLPELQPNRTIIRNIHGHDRLTRDTDYTLDQSVGKGSTHGGGQLTVLIRA